MRKLFARSAIIHLHQLGSMIRSVVLSTAGMVLLLPFLASLPVSASPTISEYPIPTTSSHPTSVTHGPDGNTWFTEYTHQGAFNSGKIGYITPSGSITEYNIPATNIAAYDIVSGPDGNLWFTTQANAIGRITPSGTVTVFTFPILNAGYANGQSADITVGSDGNLWFTDEYYVGDITISGAANLYLVAYPTLNITNGPDGNLWFTTNGARVGKISTAGTTTMYLAGFQVNYDGISSGPDGALWVTAGGTSGNNIQRINTSGSVTNTYSIPTPNAFVNGSSPNITAGSNGVLWFAEQSASKIASITTSGAITEYATPTAAANPTTIASSANGSIWFSETNADQIGQIAFAPAAPSSLTIPSPTQNPALSWNSVSGAASYNIYRDGSKISSASTATYTDNSASDGTHSYYVTAVNSGGESGPSNTVSNVLVDRTQPSITYVVTPVSDGNGYNTGNVKVTFTCTDNNGGSGVASCTSPVTVSNEGIGQTVSGTATDNAGNTTTIEANASLLVQAVNAGGNASGNYAADTSVTGGQAYSESSSAAVDTSKVTVMPANQDVYQSSRYGNMTYTFTGLTPGSNYTLRLHFNELYWGTAGQSGGVGSRVFDVTVNDLPALTNFDIYSTAGGANKAVAEELPVSADSNGNVTVQFTNVTDNALVNGLELYQGILPAEPPAPTTPPQTSADIAAGGNTAIGNFAADADFSGGQAYISSDSVDTSGVTNPAPQAVYQSDRYGNFTYTVPNLTPNANFLVRLHFSEPYWGADGRSGGVGSRLFNVDINGAQVLNNFDVYATAGGANKAVTEDFVVPSDSNGNISIQFTTVTDNAMVSGIEIEQQ